MIEQAEIESKQLLVAFENYALSAKGATASATSTAAGIGEPLIDMTPDKLTLPDVALAWRSGPLAGGPPEVSVTIRLGGPRAVNWTSIHRGNIRVPFRALYYRADPASGAAPVFTSPWTDPIVRAAFEDFSFDDFVFDLGPATETLDALASFHALDCFIPADVTYNGIRYVVLAFDVSGGANGLHDYLQFAYPIIGRVFRPQINMIHGWSQGLNDLSVIRRTESGQKRGRQKAIPRTFACALPYLERSEAFQQVYSQWHRENGKLGLVFVWPEPRERRYYYDQAMLAQMTELSTVEMARLDWPSANGFAFEEA